MTKGSCPIASVLRSEEGTKAVHPAPGRVQSDCLVTNKSAASFPARWITKMRKPRRMANKSALAGKRVTYLYTPTLMMITYLL